MPEELQKTEMIAPAEMPEQSSVETSSEDPLEQQEDIVVTEEEKENVIKEISAAESGVKSVVTKTNADQKARDEERAIEKILEADLGEVYLSMDPEQQRRFKEKGEETAKKINQLLKQAKVQIGKIIALIKEWLAIIPGINRYFLEQDAKIRADEIIKLKDN